MALPASSLDTLASDARVRAVTATVPWYLWTAVIGVTSAMIGGQWDISWHRSIGRDSFWTAPHIAIYLCGVLAGIAYGYLILATTFGGSPAAKARSVRVWGFRAPLGAFIAAWGGIAMLTSAPFDDWWHNAYGLDVKIVSPPHVLLILGIVSVVVGTLLLLNAQMNQADGELKAKLNALFLYIAGTLIASEMLFLLEYTHYVEQHGARFYRAMCIAVPLVLGLVRSASRAKWACTQASLVYTVFFLLLLWILPLFPAEPKLGPVYQQVHQFIPPGFPILLIVPAFLWDIAWPRVSKRNAWLSAAALGLLFFVALVAIQWPLASFLITPAARNAVFGAHYMDFNAPPTSFMVRYLFFPTESSSSRFWVGMATAPLIAMLTARMGLASGRWLVGAQR